MKIRLILLCLAGVAVYIVLANFHSNMLKETESPKDHGQASVPHGQPAKIPAADKPAAAPPVAVPQQAETPAPAAQAPPPAQAKTAAPPAIPDLTPPQVQMVVPVPAGSGEPTRLLQEAVAEKDQQIRQLLESQEGLAGKYRGLLAIAEKAGAGVAAKEQLLVQYAEQVKALTTAKEAVSSELAQAKAELERLRHSLAQMQAAAAEAANTIRKESVDKVQALTAGKDKAAAELDQTKTERESLRQQVEQLKMDALKAEQFIKEKVALLANLQGQVQERTEAAQQFKVQLAETVDKLVAAKAEREKAEQKAEALVRLSAENEQRAGALNEQKGTLEQTLQEKAEALNKALLIIQSLKQEVAAQPQAVATVQRLFDERTQEFEQVKKEAAVKIEHLQQQVADLGKSSDQALKEQSRAKSEAEEARKKIEELETGQAKAQTAVAEAEKKLAAAAESKTTMHSQMSDREAAISGAQAQMKELAAKAQALHDEKLGLASQLAAMQADQKNLLAMKAICEEQADALAKAESRLKEMAALQLKNEEMNKTLAEKSAALDKATKQAEQLVAAQTQLAEAAKQAEAAAATIKKLEMEKSDLGGQLAAAQAQTQNFDAVTKSLDEKSNALILAETQLKNLQALKDQVGALENKLAAAQAAKQVADKKAGEGEASIKQLGDSLSASTNKLKTLEVELAAAKTRIKELTDKNLLQAQQDMVPALNQQIATLRDQVTQMETVTAEAKKSMADNTAALQAKVEGTVQKMQALQNEKESLQQSLSASQAAVTDVQKQLEAAKAAAPVPTPAAEKLPAEATADSDKDGVADAADLCPGSSAGSTVNSLGCPAQKAVVLENVTFATGTAELTADSRKKLDQVAVALGQTPQLKVEVAGYTDNVGDLRRNNNLSTQRAQAVVAYLATKGVAAPRLTAKGFGPDNPIADNTTAEGRQKNRRIELHPIAP